MPSSNAVAEAASVERQVKADKGQPKGLTADEIMRHPAFNTTEWVLEPTQSGMCKVAEGRRGGPFNISWEVHGSGPVKIVWVMGLGAMKTAWKRQTKYFGHTHGTKYSCLIFDNRGIGRSDKPTARYSTTEMAQDVIDLLTHLKWLDTTTANPTRTLNIIGISMGGMIIQELGLLIPQHIQSLSLTSTAPRVVRTIPFMENLKQRVNMFVPAPIDVQLEEIAHRLFSASFLSQPDTEHPDPKLNYPTIRDRFAASELHKRLDKDGFTKKGFILQAVAAGWHNKSARQLKDMGDLVGRERIAVVHGTGDRMLTFPHFEMIREELGGEGGGVTFKVWEGCGHVPLWEKEDEYNELIQKHIDKAVKLGDS